MHHQNLLVDLGAQSQAARAPAGWSRPRIPIPAPALIPRAPEGCQCAAGCRPILSSPGCAIGSRSAAETMPSPVCRLVTTALPGARGVA
eukprot:scaffold29350_cov100-Isochrysis_galbana.AAC.3